MIKNIIQFNKINHFCILSNIFFLAKSTSSNEFYLNLTLQLTLAVGLTATLVSGQGQSWPSGQFPSAGFSQYQPYRGPSAPSASPSIPSTGQYQSSPQLATLSQLSGYSRLASPAQALQSGAWNPNQPGNRGWSIPAPTRSFASVPQPQSAGYSSK